jgi:hypothetical protein
MVRASGGEGTSPATILERISTRALASREGFRFRFPATTTSGSGTGSTPSPEREQRMLAMMLVRGLPKPKQMPAAREARAKRWYALQRQRVERLLVVSIH